MNTIQEIENNLFNIILQDEPYEHTSIIVACGDAIYEYEFVYYNGYWRLATV